MITQLFKHYSPPVKIVFFIFFAVVCLAITMLLGMALGYVLFGGQVFLDNLQPADIYQREALAVQKYLAGLSSIGLFVLPGLLFPLLMDEKIGVYLRLDEKPKMRSATYTAGLILAIIPLIAYTYLLNKQIPFPSGIEALFQELEANAEMITNALLSGMTPDSYLINLFLIALLPAIGEEAFFRGVIQRLFGESFKSQHLAIFVTAVLFSAIHLQFYGFFPRLILGLVLGYLFWWSKSLWLPMLAHFVNNGMAVTLKYYSEHASAAQVEKINALENSTLQYAFLSCMLVAILLYGIYQTEEINNEKTTSNKTLS